MGFAIVEAPLTPLLTFAFCPSGAGELLADKGGSELLEALILRADGSPGWRPSWETNLVETG